MIPMFNVTDVVKTVRRGPKFYQAGPGEQVSVYRVDVPFMLTAGFRRVEVVVDDTSEQLAAEAFAAAFTAASDDAEIDCLPTPDLSNLNSRELKALAQTAEIDGFRTMNKAELSSALENHNRGQ
jgi:hypothetical protein